MSASDVPAPLTELFVPAQTTPAPELPATAVPDAAEKAAKRQKSRRPAKTPRTEALELGAYPVASLLPPEVVAQGQVRKTQSLVIYLVLAVLVLAGAGVGAAHLYAQQAQGQLAQLQATNGSILAQETKYAPARTALNKVKLAQAAQKVAGGSEIDWDSYFTKVQAVLPAGVTITDISGETATASTQVSQDAAPLSLSRAADITITVSAPDANAIAETLDRLKTLPGYAGAFPGALTQGGSTTGTSTAASNSATASAAWSAPITLSLNSGAFSNRYANNDK